MNHYEIIFMIHPDQNENVKEIVKYYSNDIITRKGKIHRLEDWGRRQLAYPIKKLQKAHYILMNIEISTENIKNIEKNFRLNDNIIRSMIIKVKKPITELSIMMKIKNEILENHNISEKNNKIKIL